MKLFRRRGGRVENIVASLNDSTTPRKKFETGRRAERRGREGKREKQKLCYDLLCYQLLPLFQAGLTRQDCCTPEQDRTGPVMLVNVNRRGAHSQQYQQQQMFFSSTTTRIAGEPRRTKAWEKSLGRLSVGKVAIRSLYLLSL